MTLTAYGTDSSGWEEWQRDYQFGVILILPPPDLAREIDALRAEYDPIAFSICSAHISVSDPLSQKMTSDSRAEIRHILSEFAPFQIHFDQLQASTKHAGVHYLIRPQGPIDEIKQALHRATVFDGPEYERREIPAHMTVAEFLSIEESLKLCESIAATAPQGSFTCRELTYMVPDEQFHFRKIESFLLADT